MVRIHTTYAKRPIRSIYFAQIFGEIQNCKILNFVLFPQTRAAEIKKTGNFLPVLSADHRIPSFFIQRRSTFLAVRR
jgi:hypothetical protein